VRRVTGAHDGGMKHAMLVMLMVAGCAVDGQSAASRSPDETAIVLHGSSFVGYSVNYITAGALTTSSTTLFASPAVHPGDHVRSVTVSMIGDNGVDVSSAIASIVTKQGTPTSIGNGLRTNVPSSGIDLEIATGDAIVPDGSSLVVSVSVTGSGLLITELTTITL